jgi:tRNA U55 pseudouridine synthase TruB
MLLLTDEDTKKMATLVGHDKRYTAKIDLAHISDTWDIDHHDMYEEVFIEVIPTKEQILSLFAGIIPKAVLPLPSFSAKKIDGRRMYKSARQ